MPSFLGGFTSPRTLCPLCSPVTLDFVINSGSIGKVFHTPYELDFLSYFYFLCSFLRKKYFLFFIIFMRRLLVQHYACMEKMKKSVLVVVLTILMFSMLILASDIQPVKASGTIYIRASGSVDPSTAPIHHSGIVYTFTGNISDSIVVERSHIVIDGAGYTLKGTGTGKGIDLLDRDYVTVKNMKIKSFDNGVWLHRSLHNNITNNDITDNTHCIHLSDSSDNSIYHNNFVNNTNHVNIYNSVNFWDDGYPSGGNY